MLGWYGAVLRASTYLAEEIQHHEVGELVRGLPCGEIEAERAAHHPRRKLDLDDAQRVLVPKDDLDVRRVHGVVVETQGNRLIAGTRRAQTLRTNGRRETREILERFVGARGVRKEGGPAPDH